VANTAGVPECQLYAAKSRRRGGAVSFESVMDRMYAGTLWLFIGIPLALGSWLTICLVPLILPILFWRLLDEERTLRSDLPGYNEYASRVRHRLIPYIW
jgi:protein-S-isoprenylcysteine O-methyltransferase Ste14